MQVNQYNPYAAALNEPYRLSLPKSISQSKPDAEAFQTPDRYVPSIVGNYPTALNQRPVYQPGQNVVQLEGKNLNYRLFDDKLKLKVPYLQADMIDVTPQDPMNIKADDFNLHLNAAEMRLSDVDLSLTVGELLKNNKKVPLKDVRVVFAPDNQILVEAKVQKFGIGIPVKLDAGIQVLPSGELKADLQQLRILGIPLKGAMDTLGLTVEKILKLRQPQKGYYTKGNSFIFDITKLTTAPGISGRIQSVNTHLGDLSLVFGNQPADKVSVQQAKDTPGPNYIKLSGGHIYHDGFFVKDGDILLDDKTPENPLTFGNSEEVTTTLKRGFVGISQFRFNEILEDEIGEGSSFSNLSSELEDDKARIYGTMYGFVPIKMDMPFDKTHDGRLMFTPSNPKAFGFIPLPEKWVRKKVQGLIKKGEPYGDGVALNGIGDIKLGTLSRVLHQKGYLILDVKGQPAP